MATQTEGNYTAEFLLSEGNHTVSRDTVTVASGQNLAAGQVVGKITASGKVAAYDNAASNGTEVAVGVLYAAVDASAADQSGVVIGRMAEVIGEKLIHVTGASQAAKDAAVADLKAFNIIAR